MQDEIQKTIAEELGIAGLGSDEQRQVISDLGGIALKAATIALLEKLSPEKRTEFAKLADAGDQAAVAAFLSREVPAHAEIARQAVAEEVKRFKEYQASVGP